jgi:uncharacterized membrane protein (UPF0127 family)
MRFHALTLAAIAVAMPFAAVAVSAQTEITHAQPVLPTIPLKITTAKGAIHFRVELARTGEQQEIGLMFRTSVPAHGGMLFPMEPVREATFWMQNTVIPLDMVFIRKDGTIARITTAKQLTTSIDDSGEPVAAVLELGAGRAASLGIREGDRVTWTR